MGNRRFPQRNIPTSPAPVRVLIAGSTYVYRLNVSRNEWETITHNVSGGALAELVALIFNDDDLFFASNDEIGFSSDSGDSWEDRTSPGGVFMLDRGSDETLWVFNNNDNYIYKSTTEAQSFAVASAEVDVATAWNIAVHPLDPNRVAFSYDEATGGNSVVDITTNGGSSWTQRVIKTFDAHTVSNYTVWLPNGRLVSILVDTNDDIVYSTYSDDDGVTWAALSTLINIAPASDFKLGDLRVTEEGYVLGVVNQSVSSVSGIRSADGASFDVLDLPDTGRAAAIAFNEATGELYIAHLTDQLYVVNNARTSNWSSATEIAGVPTGAVPVGVTIGGNMVLVGEGRRFVTNRIPPYF